MVVAGAIGVGKSTLVKMMVQRALARGRRVVIIDPKGEYGALCELVGGSHVRFGAETWCDPFSGDSEHDAILLAMLLEAANGQQLSDEERYELNGAVTQCTGGDGTFLSQVYEHVRPALRDETSAKKSLALRLHRFMAGDLGRLFVGDGKPVALDARCTVIDVSAQWASSALGIVAIAVLAAVQQGLSDSGTQALLVLDEAWALLRDSSTLQWLQGSWKLARARGISHLIVLHRWSDVGAVGEEGSASRAQADGLLRECETTWLFRQPPEEASALATQLSLHPRERQALTSLTRGVVLVRYGAHRSIVAIQPNNQDRLVIDTDAAMG
jgi:type IV secretory pathway VirB4 component